jgi:hypothetical protein
LVHFRRWWNNFLTRIPEQRAVDLLKQNLSPLQRQQYEWNRSFEVIGGGTGRRYRICHSSMMNVELLDAKGKSIRLLCFMPDGRLAIADNMLAQKMALELFEDEALAVAHQMVPSHSGLIRFP